MNSDVSTTEWGYYFIQNLIAFAAESEWNSSDRRGWELSQKIELDVWYNSPIPRPERLEVYIDALNHSEDESSCFLDWSKIVSNNGIKYRVAEDNRRVSRG